ncbi:MAG: germination protein YpeB [Bacillota bacterium]|nr:germination protein YpeB [Bacillota bacterium]
MSFREKLLDLKKRLSDRKMYSIVIVVIAAVAIWGITQYRHSGELRQQLDNQYNRAFFDMTGYVHNVETLLMKSLISGSSTMTASTLQEAWRQANLAQTNLGQLPITPVVLENTSKFLTQVGDLAYSLNNQSMSGKPLNEQQYKTVQQLYTYAVNLGKNLNSLQGQLTQGRIKWSALANKGTRLFKKTSSQMPMSQFENVDKTFKDVPKLIYDGPFSDHLTGLEPKGLTGNNITADQAKQSVNNLFPGQKIKAITSSGRNDSGMFKTYNFKVTFNGAPDKQYANVTITQKGGQVLWMLYNRPSAAARISVEQAKAIGKKYLEDHGFKGMADTYYLKEDNTATVNYAYKQNNVVIYPDLIKVKIALDNGEVVGLETKSYLSAHTARTIPTPKISMQQARAAISARVNVLSSDLAIIPTDYKTELFTYEFKGKFNNQDFLVYINADTGKEENILMIVNTPNGILTM